MISGPHTRIAYLVRTPWRTIKKQYPHGKGDCTHGCQVVQIIKA